MRVFLVDGTYELFRHFHGAPPHLTKDGREVNAVRGVVSTVLQLLADGATHVGVATDHVIESFRNQLYKPYKDGSGVPPELYSQFPLLEDAMRAIGVTVWPTVELEADDALASAAATATADERVDQVVIMTPDKDLAQCVKDARVVQYDRRNQAILDYDAVVAKWGVEPESIPDLLALVGDSADGYPGLSGWGRKSAATLLAHYGSIEKIPDHPGQWDVSVRGSVALAGTLASHRDDAMLFKLLATLRIDPKLLANVDDLQWHGPADNCDEFLDTIDGQRQALKAHSLAEQL